MYTEISGQVGLVAKRYENLAAGGVAQFEERPNKGPDVGLISSQSIGRQENPCCDIDFVGFVL